MRLAALTLAVALAVPAPPALAQVPLRPDTPMILSWTPAQQAAWYPATETVFEARVVRRGVFVRPLPIARRPIAPRYRFAGRTWTVEGYMKATRASGVLALKDGRIILERYGLGRTPDERWTSFSVAKSVTSMLVGAAIEDGKLRLDEPVTEVIGELEGSAYVGVTLRDLLTMSSGVKWNEDYADPASDIARAGEPMEKGVDPFVAYVRRLPREQAPGTVFHYDTANTDLVGVMVARAVGETLANYLSDKIWRPYGMESDAYWLVDGAGQERGGCCLSMTLRDYARFGQFVLDGARIAGRTVTTPDWVHEATRVQIANGRPPPSGYGYFWWIGPEAFEASGIFGQSILIYPKDRLVLVINSAWPKADGEAMYAPMAAFQRAVRAAARAAR